MFFPVFEFSRLTLQSTSNDADSVNSQSANQQLELLESRETYEDSNEGFQFAGTLIVYQLNGFLYHAMLRGRHSSSSILSHGGEGFGPPNPSAEPLVANQRSLKHLHNGQTPPPDSVFGGGPILSPPEGNQTCSPREFRFNSHLRPVFQNLSH